MQIYIPSLMRKQLQEIKPPSQNQENREPIATLGQRFKRRKTSSPDRTHTPQHEQSLVIPLSLETELFTAGKQTLYYFDGIIRCE